MEILGAFAKKKLTWEYVHIYTIREYLYLVIFEIYLESIADYTTLH